MRWLMISLLLVYTNCVNASTHYVSQKRGNDATGDGTFSTPWKTLGQLNSETITAGDTIVCSDTVATSTFSPNFDGTSGNVIVLIDSASYTDGLALNTNKESSWAVINGSGNAWAINITSETDYIQLFGFEILSGSNGCIQYGNTSNNDWSFLKCRIKSTSSFYAIRINGGNSNLTVASCLILSSGFYELIKSDGYVSGTFNFINNTVTGSPGGLDLIIWGSGGLNPSAIIKNNIFYYPYSNAGTDLIQLSDSYLIDDIDYNLYYCTSANPWQTADSSITTFTGWRNWVQNNGDANGESNSINTNPNLTNTTTICDWVDGEAQDEAADDLGYGTDIGYWQDIESAGSPTPTTKPKFIPPTIWK